MGPGFRRGDGESVHPTRVYTQNDGGITIAGDYAPLTRPDQKRTTAHTSSVTVTGTWSDGRSQPRAARRIWKSLIPSFSARETQM